MDHDLIADFPALDLVTHGPNDPGGIRACDVEFRFVNIKWADRNTQTGPDAVIVHTSRHHEHKNLVAVRLRHIDNFKLEGFLWLTVTFAANGPRMHLRRHIAQRWHLADFIQVFLGCRISSLVEGHLSLHHLCSVVAAPQNRCCWKLNRQSQGNFATRFRQFL